MKNVNRDLYMAMILFILWMIGNAVFTDKKKCSCVTLTRSHAVLWVELDIQKRHLSMLGRSHEELINQANSNTMATQGESGRFNQSRSLCYSCHKEIK